MIYTHLLGVAAGGSPQSVACLGFVLVILLLHNFAGLA